MAKNKEIKWHEEADQIIQGTLQLVTAVAPMVAIAEVRRFLGLPHAQGTVQIRPHSIHKPTFS